MELGHPAIQSGLFPLISAFVLTGVLRLVGGSRAGVRAASGATGIALLISSLLVLGAPAWPAHTGMQKFFYLTASGLLLGLLLDLRAASVRLLWLWGLIWMAAAFVWLAWPQRWAGRRRFAVCGSRSRARAGRRAGAEPPRR